MAISLNERVALVTGGGAGLGREYALALAKAGAKVVVNDYGGDLQGKAGTISRAQSVVNEITALGGNAVPDGGDVSKDAKTIVGTALNAFGRLDILVNNAGITGRVSSHADIDVDAFTRVWQISTLGTAMMTSAAYPVMQSRGYGRIINVSSNGIFGLDTGGDCAYSSAKAGVFAMTRELGRFAPRHGIKINALLPGGGTRMADASEAAREIGRKYLPAEEVAPFVVLLASEECPVSGEGFECGAGRAARCTLTTFPGSLQSTAEGWLEDWAKVMGDVDDIYVPLGAGDDTRYMIKQATGDDLDFSNFGISTEFANKH
ncbi:NAD(P)-binding protein [Aspergillus unguis]